MPNQHNFAKRRSCSRFQSLTDIDRPGGGGNGNANQGISKERKKFVTFTVDLLSEGEPLGMTLASDTSAETPGPIYISAVTPGKNFNNTVSRSYQFGPEFLKNSAAIFC